MARRRRTRLLIRCLATLLLMLPGGAFAAECNDSLDNDGDGLTDLADPDCVDAADPFEGVGVLSGQKLSDSTGDLSGPGNPGGLLADGDRFGNSMARSATSTATACPTSRSRRWATTMALPTRGPSTCCCSTPTAR